MVKDKDGKWEMQLLVEQWHKDLMEGRLTNKVTRRAYTHHGMGNIGYVHILSGTDKSTLFKTINETIGYGSVRHKTREQGEICIVWGIIRILDTTEEFYPMIQESDLITSDGRFIKKPEEIVETELGKLIRSAVVFKETRAVSEEDPNSELNGEITLKDLRIIQTAWKRILKKTLESNESNDYSKKPTKRYGTKEKEEDR